MRHWIPVRRLLPALLLALLPLPAAAETGTETRLLRHPDINAQHIVFSYGGDIWQVAREGGTARRLTAFPGFESYPRLSPDGGWVAFSGQYDGNTDVFVMSIDGGEPRRLTWHPGTDTVRGWTPDGTRIIFASGRDTAPTPYPRFWTVDLQASFPQPMPMPRAWRGGHSPDGRHFAYEMVASYEDEWRNYRGGQNKPIWILDLDDLSVEKIGPWEGSNDSDPVWMEDTIYFLSDRDFAVNVWSYQVGSGRLRQLTRFSRYDAKNLAGRDGSLVFEHGGFIHRLDPGAGSPVKVPITVRGDFPWARKHWEDVSGMVRTAAVSPGGKRALMEARGEIFSVPAEKGDIRNLSRSPATAERAPAWSPDGTRVSWFSDASGEYALVIADPHGTVIKRIPLPDPTFYYTPAWSPDSSRLSFGDADRNLWVVEISSGRVKRIDNEGFAHPVRYIAPAWSPDSRWIAYTRRLPNQFNAVSIYSVADGTTHLLTHGLSDSLSPAWDASGKYLYFLSSTDFGLNVGWLDMTSYQRPVTRAIYLAVLAAGEPSPTLPESDEEEPAADEKAGSDDGDRKKKKGDGSGKTDARDEADTPPRVVIDFKGLEHRIVALDIPPRNILDSAAGPESTIFYREAEHPGAVLAPPPEATLHRYSLEEREGKKLLSGVAGFTVSSSREQILYSRNAGPATAYHIIEAASDPAADDGGLDLGDLRLLVDPRAEWRQIFREAWRYQRDYFYVDNVHGLDLDAAWEQYAPWLDHVRHRNDLTHLLDILGGETAVGHSFTGGGDAPDVEQVPTGLLGADLEVDRGHYRIARIYSGESWNPGMEAPLSGPGLDVQEGDYILEVNGRPLPAPASPYRAFAHTAGKQTVLLLNDRPDPKGARTVTVVPVPSESRLRTMAWVENNRRLVDTMSGGRLAYVWLPNTGGQGYTFFNRYYFAQQDRQGAVIDERFNGGGSIADYMVELMDRKLMGYFNNPVGNRQPFTAPNGGIWGPKVMLINDAAGSGGDMLPYMFRLRGIGPLVGTRTWGGLVGIWDVPSLLDGGFITSPRGGFYDLDGQWKVENEGVPPDIEVEQLPAATAQGRDPQLLKAVEVALDLLEKNPVRHPAQPPDPVRVRRPE